MTNYKDLALGIDISLYNTVTDWAILADHVDFVTAKCSEGVYIIDPKFSSNCQSAYDHGIPFGAYHYFIASYYLQFPFPGSDEALAHWPKPEDDLQLQNLIHALSFKTFYWLAIDLEETGNKNVDKVWMAAAAKIFVGRVADWLAQNHPDVQLFVYTRNSYIAEYAPGINNWIGQYNSWICAPYWATGNVSVSWEQLRAAHYPPDAYKFGYFSTRPTWEMVQWSIDRFHLPGLSGAVDTNFVSMSRDEFIKWIKFVPHEAPPAPPPVVLQRYKVIASAGLNVRSEPDLYSTPTGLLAYGTQIDVSEIQEQQVGPQTYRWGRHMGGWSCIDAATPVVYMTKA